MPKNIAEKLKPSEFEEKRQSDWMKHRIYQPDVESAKRPFYNLMMFPYPSAEGLHVGNVYAFTGADIYGRYQRMRGNDVFEPIGLDGFGIHSENYAIKVGRHPREQAKESQKNFYRQLSSIGNGFAWENRLETYDPDYYKWTQWLFVQMFKKGLAYRKKSPVNFCPSCKTVLSDEQVIDGRCERCKSIVGKRLMEQWFFRITTYAGRLLNNTYKKEFKWPEKVKIGQRNWIGRSEGVQIEFKVQSSKFKVEVFTTAIDTVFGVTFMVLSPDHPLVSKLEYTEDKRDDVEDYIKVRKSKTNKEKNDKEKTGVFTGLYAVNPFNNKEVPIFIADYVLMEYGTGAIMAVPGHDARDYEFAKKYKLEIIYVVKPASKIQNDVKIEKDGFWDYSEIKTKFGDQSALFNSGSYNGLSSNAAKRIMEKEIEEKRIGKKVVTYKLRDWCVSRQRYWGAPIPMVNCKNCGWIAVPDDQLPVLLPDLTDWKPEGTGKGPLAKLKDWVRVKCPECGGDADRETDVCDTFLDSSWYFLRYPSVNLRLDSRGSKLEFEVRGSKMENKNQSSNFHHQDLASRFKSPASISENLPWDPEITKKWLPVNIYIGGAEHTVLHLLYARFVTMALYDWKLVDFEEPFQRFYAHGLIIARGAKMSKSRGNVVVPDEYIKAYGADTLRTYLMFLGPFDKGGDFRDTGIAGMYRFLNRVWRLVNEQFDKLTAKSDGEPLNKILHKTIKGVTEDIENLRYNTAISKLMEYVNALSDNTKYIRSEHISGLLLMLAPFAPYMTEELFQLSKVKSQKSKVKSDRDEFESIHKQPWPEYDQKYLLDHEVRVIVQVNGKTRDVLSIKYQVSNIKEKVEEKAKESQRVNKYLEGKTIRKTIFVPGKIINFVV